MERDTRPVSGEQAQQDVNAAVDKLTAIGSSIEQLVTFFKSNNWKDVQVVSALNPTHVERIKEFCKSIITAQAVPWSARHDFALVFLVSPLSIKEAIVRDSTCIEELKRYCSEPPTSLFDERPSRLNHLQQDAYAGLVCLLFGVDSKDPLFQLSRTFEEALGKDACCSLLAKYMVQSGHHISSLIKRGMIPSAYHEEIAIKVGQICVDLGYYNLRKLLPGILQVNEVRLDRLLLKVDRSVDELEHQRTKRQFLPLIEYLESVKPSELDEGLVFRYCELTGIVPSRAQRVPRLQAALDGLLNRLPTYSKEHLADPSNRRDRDVAISVRTVFEVLGDLRSLQAEKLDKIRYVETYVSQQNPRSGAADFSFSSIDLRVSLINETLGEYVAVHNQGFEDPLKVLPCRLLVQLKEKDTSSSAQGAVAKHLDSVELRHDLAAREASEILDEVRDVPRVQSVLLDLFILDCISKGGLEGLNSEIHLLILASRSSVGSTDSNLAIKKLNRILERVPVLVPHLVGSIRVETKGQSEVRKILGAKEEYQYHPFLNGQDTSFNLVFSDSNALQIQISSSGVELRNIFSISNPKPDLLIPFAAINEIKIILLDQSKSEQLYFAVQTSAETGQSVRTYSPVDRVLHGDSPFRSLVYCSGYRYSLRVGESAACYYGDLSILQGDYEVSFILQRVDNGSHARIISQPLDGLELYNVRLGQGLDVRDANFVDILRKAIDRLMIGGTKLPSYKTDGFDVSLRIEGAHNILCYLAQNALID